MFFLLQTEVAQRILSEEEKREVQTMRPFVALHYLHWMLCAKYARPQVSESNYRPPCLKLNFDVLQCANLPPSADSTPETGSRGDALCRHCFGEVGKASQLPHA